MSTPSGFQPRPLKYLFTANQCWPVLLDARGLRDIEVEAVTKMLACSTSILGVRQYRCSHENCPHQKCLCNTCHSRACPCCGQKATDQWITTQNHRLPDCAWQHLVFTQPDTLWPLFFYNRHLLEAVCRLAVDNLLYAARQRWVIIGIFCAIHTYGRRLNWHPHVHVSVTCRGLDKDGVWRDLAYHKAAIRRRWMWNLRQFLISQWDQLQMPPQLQWIDSESTFKHFVRQAGGSHWHIYVSKKTHNGRKMVEYLGAT